MNLNEKKETWVAQDQKLNENIRLSKALLKTVCMDKSKSRTQSVLYWRIVEVIVFSVLVISLWKFIVTNFSLSAATISAVTLVVFTIIGLARSIGQIVLINQIDYSAAVSTVQKQIYAIRDRNLKNVRLTLLSIPFYMAYIFLGFELIFGFDLHAHVDQTWIAVNIAFSVTLIVLTVWLVSKLNSHNSKLGWIRQVAEELGGHQLAVAAQQLGEIDEFENE